MDQIALQSPANAGTLAPTGKLGADAGRNAGFDIYSTLDDSGKTVDAEGYATLQVGDDSELFEINLLTGEANSNGNFRKSVTDLAIKLNQR